MLFHLFCVILESLEVGVKVWMMMMGESFTSGLQPFVFTSGAQWLTITVLTKDKKKDFSRSFNDTTTCQLVKFDTEQIFTLAQGAKCRIWWQQYLRISVLLRLVPDAVWTLRGEKKEETQCLDVKWVKKFYPWVAAGMNVLVNHLTSNADGEG